MNIGILFIIGILVLGLVLLLNHDAGTIMNMEIESFAKVGFLAILAAFISLGAFRGVKLSQGVRYMLIWLLLALGLVTVYAYRAEFQQIGNRLAGELIPGLAVSSTEDGTVVIRRGSNEEHFHVHAELEGKPIHLMVDTGASAVVLTAEDARKLGYDPDSLDYLQPVDTANGRTYVASIWLDRVRIGAITLENVRAAVAQPDQLFQSLLGMSFLGRLSAYEVRGNTLTLIR